MPDIRIREVGGNELGLLLSWREEVLRCVFSLPENADTSALMQANEAYYKSAVPSGRTLPALPRKEARPSAAAASACTTRCLRLTILPADALI